MRVDRCLVAVKRSTKSHERFNGELTGTKTKDQRPKTKGDSFF
jgi:hypothetical protein